MEILRERLVHPSAWMGTDFKSKQDFTLDLSDAQLREIDAHLQAALADGATLDTLGPTHFRLPDMAPFLAEVRETLRSGTGLVILRGIDTDRYSEDELGMIYWGLGTHFGTGVSQSVMGDRIGHVKDFTAIDPHARAYRNKQELTPHTDLSDVVGLMCLQSARTGGVTVATSSIAVHNELVERYPEFLEPLYEGFIYHRMGEQPPGHGPMTPHRVPVFSWRGGQLSCRYVRSYIQTAARESDTPLTSLQTEALNCIERLSYECAFEFSLEPGEIYLINNYTVLHARTAFQDWDEVERKRHLLRLWLTAPDWRELDPQFELYDGSVGRGGIPAQPGKRPAYAGATGRGRIAT